LLEDTSGARWRYLHLNANNWQIGNTITKGTIIGTHSTYPIPGQCGSGPHLHLERRSAGGFRDSEVFKTCQFGTKSCNYDPNKPFPGAGKNALVHLLTNPVIEQAASAFVVPVREMSAGSCKRDPAMYPRATNRTLADYRLSGNGSRGGVKVAYDTLEAGDYTQLQLAAVLGDNANNQCGAGQNCLVSWQVLAETETGLKRVFFDASLRNRKARVISAEQLCLPADATGRLHVLTRDFEGNQLRTVVTLD
jgi:hypothetical protein